MSVGGTSLGGGFRRRGAADRASLHLGPNMTPMVDVVMVILVFFMASAAFVGPEWFLAAQTVERKPEVTTTPAGGNSQQPRAPVLRIVLKAGAAGGGSAGGSAAQATVGMILGGKREANVPVGELVERIAALLKGAQVPGQPPVTEAVILPEPGISYELVVRVRESVAQAAPTLAVGITPLTAEDER